MRLPVPGPRDLLSVLERGASSVEQLLALAPRVVSLVGETEALMRRVGTLLDDIEATRRSADGVVTRAGRAVGGAEATLTRLEPLSDRLEQLLDRLAPPLERLQPVLERLADTTDPHEVDALVRLVDQLPALATKLETDVMPILDSLGSVAPDLHDLLDVSRELNLMLAQVPGISRMKKRIDKRQEDEGRG